MSVRRLSNSTISFQGKPKSTTFIAGYSPAIDEMDLIQRVTVDSGGLATVVFDNIPSTYQHLQLRYICRSTYNPAGTFPIYYIEAKFNSDSGTNYSYHEIYGDGSSILGSGAASQGLNYFGYHATAKASTSVFGGAIVDILDYANTNKNKVCRSLTGGDNNGSGRSSIISTMWNSTAALNKITIAGTFISGNISQYSVFSLYGIKA